MLPLKITGLIYGPHMHHLDHIGCMCALLDIPLIVTEDDIGKAASRYYPGLTVFTYSMLELPHSIAREYDVVISSLPKPLFEKIFFISQHLHRKKLISVWCPHGNSDKGRSQYFMEALSEDKILLVYGNKMIDFLKEKGVYTHIFESIIIGNYRWLFYKKLKDFYDSLIQELLNKAFIKQKKIVLYAPTWKDSENATSFFDAISFIIQSLPEKYNLIIKPHPNLLITENQTILKCMDQYTSHSSVYFLLDFPVIYPLLNAIDVYIGDMSSIGYDFLIFDRPMLFLDQQKHSLSSNLPTLFQCGITLLPEKYSEIYSLLEMEILHDFEQFSDKRRALYAYTFGEEEIPLEKIKKRLIETCQRYADEEPQLL